MQIRPYRIEIRVKNNRLLQALKDTFPAEYSIKAFSTRLGVNYGALCQILAVKTWPYSAKNGWLPIAKQISLDTGKSPEYLFDPDLYGRKARPVVLEMDMPAWMLEQAGMVSIPEAPDVAADRGLLSDAVRNALKTLTPREERVLRLCFGIGDGRNHTLEEVGQQFGVTPERIRQIEAKALRKLRRPIRAERLRPFIE